jgi:hypothetical protein
VLESEAISVFRTGGPTVTVRSAPQGLSQGLHHLLFMEGIVIRIQLVLARLSAAGIRTDLLDRGVCKMRSTILFVLLAAGTGFISATAAAQPSTTLQAAQRVNPAIRRANPATTSTHSAAAAKANLAKLSAVQSVPDGFWWDSGEQQCEASGRKIVYHFWKEPISDPDYPGAVWVVRYHVKSEYHATGGWFEDNGLFAIDYSISFQGGQTLGNRRSVDKMKHDTDELVTGFDYTPWSAYSFTVYRYGGAHGFQKTWPDPNNQTNSCDAS